MQGKALRLGEFGLEVTVHGFGGSGLVWGGRFRVYGLAFRV